MTSEAVAPQEIEGPWNVTFAPKLGQSFELDFPELIDFAKHPDDAVNNFAGTATYRRSVAVRRMHWREINASCSSWVRFTISSSFA